MYRLFAVIYCLILPQFVAAQQVSLDAPLVSSSYGEAVDFASVELGNPWDFSQRRDIGFEVGFQGHTVGASSGQWSAVSGQVGAYVFPLFGGYSGSLFAEGLDSDRSLPRFGANHPIDSSKYYYLSIRSRNSAPSTYAVYWNSKPEVNLFPDGSQSGASIDGFYFYGAQRPSGFEIRSFDLRQASFEQRSGQWTGSIAALRFDPSVFAPAGSETQIDWIRLVDPSSAPTIDIRWSLSDVSTDTLVTVYLDTDSVGYDGTPLARFIQGASSGAQPQQWFSSHPQLQQNIGHLSYPSAALPPGQYYFYVTLETAQGNTLRRVSQSGYSAPISIRSAPGGYFKSPAPDAGQDYAQSELNNPWDMSQLEDVKNAEPGSFPQELRQFSNASSQGGVFQATADTPLAGNSESDAQILLSVAANKMIDTRQYRYLQYRIAADPLLYPSIEDKVAGGWVTRPIFWDGDLFAKGGSFKAHILYEGMHTYTIDLWDDSQVEFGLGWRGVGRVSHLRIDPLETSVPTWFFIDSVSLRKQSTPVGDSFNISWVLEDTDSSQLSYELYLDSDNQGWDGQLIHSQASSSVGLKQFTLSTKNLADGQYYPYVRVYDESSQRYFYSSTPIVVGDEFPKLLTRSNDYDGDGISDPVVYRPAIAAGQSGRYFVQPSSSNAIVRDWGLAGYQPISGDFDGDSKADVGVVAPINAALHWFIIRSSDGGLYYRMWGYAGDVPAIADYNGDNSDEIAVFRNGQWYAIDSAGAVQVAAWGQFGDVPVPGDFDGDGRDDFAIWRVADGTWWIISSGFASGQFSQPYIVRKWGLAGDIPHLADFDGDQRSDFIVWRPSNGTWYLQNSSDGATQAWQWGLPGDVARVGHYISRNSPAFSVWRPSLGQWFYRDRKDATAVVQWGLPGDILPQ